jgi:probable F420-dependent oxidoreductase
VPKIRVGAQIQPQQGSFRDMRDAWLRAEEAGADVITTWDHFYPLYGDPDGPHFECWTVLGAMAEVTERAEIGALVTCNSYRNPQVLADMARTVDHISGGRLILGIGAGWFKRDYDEFGFEFGTAGDRLRHLRESLPLIRSRLGKGNPPPVRQPMPLMIGGGGERVTLRIVAEHADIWHSFADLETFEHKSGILDEHCRKVGRDPSEIERSVGAPSGNLDKETLDRYVELGATFFTAGSGGPDWNLDGLRQLVAYRDAVNGS